MWARREILPAHYNAQGPMMPWSPWGGAEVNPEDVPVPSVYVDATRRRDAEAFAAQLEEIGAPPTAPPEALEYARIDAAALLQRLAGADRALLEELQAALVAKDGEAFCRALEAKKVGTSSLRKDLEAGMKKGDKPAMADALRRMGLPALNTMMARSGPKPVMAKEIGGPFDPVMGTERRCAIDCYLTGKPIYPKSFEDRRPLVQESEPVVYATIALGYDAATWEQDCQFHPYVQDAANAVMDLAIEAHGTGELDGRLNGTRPFGTKY